MALGTACLHTGGRNCEFDDSASVRVLTCGRHAAVIGSLKKVPPAHRPGVAAGQQLLQRPVAGRIGPCRQRRLLRLQLRARQGGCAAGQRQQGEGGGQASQVSGTVAAVQQAVRRGYQACPSVLCTSNEHEQYCVQFSGSTAAALRSDAHGTLASIEGFKLKPAHTNSSRQAALNVNVRLCHDDEHIPRQRAPAPGR